MRSMRTLLCLMLSFACLAVVGCGGSSSNGDCSPVCTGKVCGDDGCGGSCGTCGAGQACNASGQCVACTASCAGKVCGDDGCGGSCGTCGSGQACNASGQCAACTPSCAGKVCGADGCGGFCGTCSLSQTCNASGQCVTLSLAAQVVGAYTEVGTNCGTGTWFQGYALFICPGGRLRGAGTFGQSSSNVTELMCANGGPGHGITVAPPTFSSCTDRLGCFPKVTATFKDTIILSGQSQVEDPWTQTFYMVDNQNEHQLWMPATCKNGSSGFVVLKSIDSAVSENYCNSTACPQSGGSSGGSGTCGTDCDCGHCWYCESGTCRFGGQGPFGCYRGCPF